jgi:hypothetical protein
MSENKKQKPVEMPNLKINREDIPETYRSYSKLPFFITLASAALVLVIVVIFLNSSRQEIIASIPKLEKAWIVSRIEGEAVATTEDKTVLNGRGVMLYFVAYGLDETEDKRFYYVDGPGEELPSIILDGKEIAAEELRKFDFVETIPVVHWTKMEVSSRYFFRRNQHEMTDVTWTSSRTHRMGNQMWAIADSRADILDSHFDHAGTMFYTAELIVSHSKNGKVLGQISTYAELAAPTGRLPQEVHRVTTVPETRSGLDAAYRAYFNTISFEDWNGLQEPELLTAAFRGGSSRSIMAGALRLMGYAIEADDVNLLEKNADLLFDNLTLDSFLFFRPDGNANGVIPYGEGGVAAGDIIKCGERYLVLVENTIAMNEPEGGVLTGDDVVLDAWDNMAQPRFANILEEMDEPISIWRLKPLAD